MRPNEREMYRFRNVTPFISLSKTFSTRQFTVTIVGQRVIQTLRPRMYMIQNLSATDIFFGGNDGITVANGFPLPSEERLIFGMTENTELWAIVSTGTVVMYILEMGI